MPPQAAHFNLISLAIVALVVWRVYQRIRRLVGRQRLHPRRPWFTVVLFPLLFALLAFGALAVPGGTLALGALAGGAVAGVGLGVVGLRLTRFEVTPEGLFYTPSAHLGVTLSLLFIARIGYRLLQLYVLDGHLGAPDPSFGRSPLTLGVFALMAGYYVSHAIGLLRWKRSVAAAAQQAPSATPAP